MDLNLPEQPEKENITDSNDLKEGSGNSPDNQEIYREDPEFKEILSAYQNANWEFCLKGLDKFQKLFPDDKFLSSFRKEIEVRYNLEVERKKQQKKEKRSELGKKWGWVLIVLAVVVLTSWGYFSYQNRINEEQQVLESIKLAQSLDTKFQNAENFMLAGKPEEALSLYQEIQQVDSSYSDIENHIEQAKAAITVENLYQEGVMAQSAGNLELALSTFNQVDILSPKYKDTAYLIDNIRRKQQVDRMVNGMQDAYSKQDWKTVASDYETILELDPYFVLTDENKELLFISLHNLVIQTVDKGSLKLEEIESAVRYYQMAIALFPQDKKFTDERENLHNTTTDLLINKYYLYATNLLEDSNYNSQSLNEAIRILTQVENIGGGSESITQEIKKTRLFLESYDHFLNNEFDLAIKGFEELRKIEEDYAGGKVSYLLFESYMAYGDILFKFADFAGARDQFLEAEKFAWRDSDHDIRLFQVELRVAKALNRLWAPDDSASYYHYAFGLIDYEQPLLDGNNQEILNLLFNANIAFDDGKMRDAITLYEKVVEEKDKLFDYDSVKVNHGDSLPDLAFQYGCTIEILKTANQLGDSLIIQLDQDLLIPVD
jgi:type II secretory pathway pseudopilin PulG